MATNQNEINQAMQNLIKMGLKPKSIWKNAAPASAFATQTLKSVDWRGAKFVGCDFTNGVSVLRKTSDMESITGFKSISGYCGGGYSTGYQWNGYRDMDLKDDGTIYFSDFFFKRTNSQTRETNNKNLVPLDIYILE